jgi:hypothetical protein
VHHRPRAGAADPSNSRSLRYNPLKECLVSKRRPAG